MAYSDREFWSLNPEATAAAIVCEKRLVKEGGKGSDVGAQANKPSAKDPAIVSVF